MLDSLQSWFADARFGLFVHWGMYSLYGRGEQVLFREHLSPSEYYRRADEFQPAHYDPRVWAEAAVRAGMRYAVFTAKHHDGYCLFDSALCDLTCSKTGAHRDLVAEYVEAFRAAGIRVGLYYSLADWRWPAYFDGPERRPEEFAAFIEYIHGQVRELCSNYGRIDVIWFDGAWPHDAATWRSAELMAMIRGLQPGILINDRLGLPGDFGTPEQRIAAAGAGRAWEACITATERHWGYHAGDRIWKTPEQVIHMLAQIGEGAGNLLLNVGPQADGTWPAPFVNLLRDVGDWIAANGESLYHCSPGICEAISLGRQTVVGNTVYLHVLYWPGSTLHLAGLDAHVLGARFLADGWPIQFTQEGEHIWLRRLPSLPPDSRDTVIALTCDDVPRGYSWARDRLWQGDASRMTDWSLT